MELERNDEHFEEVLGRLDSLIRHGQPATPPPPPPPVSEATIPVLTEIYEVIPEQAGLPDSSASTGNTEIQVSEEEKLEQAVIAVLPIMTAALEEALLINVKPAMEHAFSQALDSLRPQVETLLRQQLHTALMESRKTQTET